MSEQDGVGSVGVEAVKLLQALQDWAKDGAGDQAQAAAAAAESAAAGVHRLNEHVATGSAECRYCPVCQVISAVRSTSPEVRQHLSSAATSLLHAAAGVLATTPPEPGRRRTGTGPVERIDLDDDDPPGDTGSDEWEDS